MSYRLVTDQLNIQSAKALKTDIESSAYFVFAAKYTPYSDASDDVIPVPSFDRATISSIYDNMIFGRRIKTTDVRLMVRRYDWVYGTYYDQYSDTDPALSSKRFYVLVADGSNYNVYKCLSNNNGSPSTTAPFGTDIYPFETPADGYMWKYMYTVSDFEYRRFATSQYIPVGQGVAAGVGTIDTIRVVDGGLGYNNYLNGSFETSNDIYVDGDTTKFAIGPGSNVNKFYIGCLIKITSGLAVNEYREVVDYYISGGQRVIKVAGAFVGQVRPTDTFEITPMVYIYDTGNSSTTTCVGRAIINPNAANSISRVEVLNSGESYRTAVSVVAPDTTVGVSVAASLVPVISPQSGHGGECSEELFAKFVGVSTSFIGNTEVYTTANDFRMVGLIRNPLYANVAISIVPEDTKGSFNAGESLFHYKPYKIAGTVTLSANSLVSSDTIDFSESFRADDRILISTGDQNLLTKVSVISGAGISITDVPTFTSSNCSISILETSDFGQIVSVTPQKLVATNITPSEFQFTPNIVSNTTSTTATLDSTGDYPLTVNGRSLASFSSFLQLTKLVGTLDSEATFTQDEMVSQTNDDNITPKAIFHSLEDNLDGSYSMYLINVNKNFRTTDMGGDGVIVGVTSGAQFAAQYKYDGELVRDSGQIMYIENINPVSRSPNQTETIKLILEC